MANNQSLAQESLWHWWHSLGLLLIVVFIGAIGLFFPMSSRRAAWFLILILMGLFVVLVGHGVTGLYRGVLADERNKISLSRLQMILWTVVILAGFITLALGNLSYCAEKALDIGLPQELWMLLGISTASLVGSPLIRSTKTTQEPNPQEMEKTLGTMSVNYKSLKEVAGELKNEKTPQKVPENLANTVTNLGQVVVNLNPKAISWADLFRGEETGNAAQIDLGKIQMFFFTLIGVLTYGAALAVMFANQSKAIYAFPDLSQGLVALLGISHAGYMVNKAVPHSETKVKD